MKEIEVLHRFSMLFLYDQKDGSYETIQLSDDALDRLIQGLQRAKQFRGERIFSLQVIEPSVLKIPIPQT